MDTCRTIKDVLQLFDEYDVQVKCEYDKVFFLMPPTDDWAPGPVSISQNDINDSSGVGFKREVHDVVRGLGSNPQFQRCTSVAHHLTNWAQSCGKHMGILRLEKKAGKPFTVHFVDEDSAEDFNDIVFLHNALKGREGYDGIFC